MLLIRDSKHVVLHKRKSINRFHNKIDVALGFDVNTQLITVIIWPFQIKLASPFNTSLVFCQHVLHKLKCIGLKERNNAINFIKLSEYYKK
jgi:hypothetical protein